MATSADTLVKRVRRFVRDYPDLDVLAASLSSNGTTISVADTSSLYHANRQVLEIGEELVYVTAIASGSTLTVRRGVRGTTAATHASGATMLVNPRFFYQDVLDGLNSALDASWPLLYKPVVDGTLFTAQDTYEYVLPTIANGTFIPYIEWIRLKEPGDLQFRHVTQWYLRRGPTAPAICFKFLPVPNSQIAIKGVAPLTHLASASDTIDATVPYQAEDIFVYYAGSWLALSGEAYRARTDTGVIDKREQATRPGTSLSVSNAMVARFQARLSACAMPPPGKHLIPTLP